MPKLLGVAFCGVNSLISLLSNAFLFAQLLAVFGTEPIPARQLALM
jgi:hypothetical protein